MKKFFTLLMAVLTFGSAIVSCSDKDADAVTPETPDAPVTPTPADSADYTLIYWGMAGKLDAQVAFDLANLAYNYQQGRIGKNVQIAGLMKTSLAKAGEDVDASYDKTWYFDSGNIGTDAISADDVDLTKFSRTETQQLYKQAFDNMGGKEYGDTLYPLNNADSLANFIRKTAEKFPARHYVLVSFGHGSGFSPVADTPVTKALVADDFRDNAALSADQVVDAVQKSGVKIQTFLTQSCLMGTLENIAAYRQVFDYTFLSCEPIINFYLPEYLVKLSQVGDDEAKMVQVSRDEVDYYASRMETVEKILGIGTGSSSDISGEMKYAGLYTSYGFYDLKKSDALLAATKEAADWYTSNYTDSLSRDAIEKALASTVICLSLGDAIYPKDADSLRAMRIEVQKVIGHDVEEFDAESFKKLLKTANSLLVESSGYGLCMADMMRNTIAADLPEEKTAALKTIYRKYLAAVKDMAYIRATNKPAKADADYDYIYTSPSINVFALNSEYFIGIPVFADLMADKLVEAIQAKDWKKVEELGHELLDGCVFASPLYGGTTLEDATYNYTSSVFDKLVGWSSFLKKLQFNPSFAICPDRWQVNAKMN